MCYSISFLERRAEKLTQRYQHTGHTVWVEGTPDTLPQYYFVSFFEKPTLPVLTAEGWYMQQWGLIPTWVKDRQQALDIQKHTGNAKCETVFEKPAYRHTIMHHRCIIPVSGFFEWHTAGKQKIPFYIYPAQDNFFSLGGIYDTWYDALSSSVIKSFSIITTAANPMMAKIHNQAQRMPLIIPKAYEARWLQSDLTRAEIEALMQPAEDSLMQAHPVSQLINYAKNVRNVPQSIEKVDYGLNL